MWECIKPIYRPLHCSATTWERGKRYQKIGQQEGDRMKMWISSSSLPPLSSLSSYLPCSNPTLHICGLLQAALAACGFFSNEKSWKRFQVQANLLLAAPSSALHVIHLFISTNERHSLQPIIAVSCSMSSLSDNRKKIYRNVWSIPFFIEI